MGTTESKPTRIARRLALSGAALAVIATVCVLLFRSFDDGVPPWRHRQESPEQHAAELTRHREAQRAQQPVQPVTAPQAADDVGKRDGGSPAVARTTYWTDFRGPRRDGHYRERAILTEWPAEGLRPVWKQPIGGGHASFVVAEGRAFTIEQRGGEEVVAAYDVATGREQWTASWAARFTETYGGEGPRATPVWHAGTVFALGAAGEFRALDAATGRLRWRNNILDDAAAANLEWAMAASPLIVGDTVIVMPGGADGRSVVAYDRTSGTRKWSALDDRAAYSSPMLVTLAGVEQLLIFTGTRLVGLTTDGARVLWEFPWPTQSGINPSQPLVLEGDRVFVSTGYGMGAALFRVSRDGDRFAVTELWRTNRMKNQFTSSVYLDGFIYGLDEAILACLDAATGELKWKGGRYGYGQVMLAGGHLIVVTEDGDLALVRATPERHVELARFHALDGRTWNHPALSDGYLLVRNGSEMAAFDLRRVK